jgi:hypothetical protein
MSIITQPALAPDPSTIAIPTEPIFRFTVEQYHERQKYSRTGAIPIVLDGHEIGVVAVPDIIP